MAEGNYKEIRLEEFLNLLRAAIMKLKSPLIADWTAQQIQKAGLNKSYLALGKAGVGKSEGVAGLCEELSIGYKEYRLVTSTETDLIGLPYVGELSNDNIDENSPEFKRRVQQKVMMFATNNQMPYADRDGEIGICVFDEITSCARDVQAAALQLFDASRGVGEYKLPTKWICVALGNGEGDGGVYRQLPPALNNRFLCCRVMSNPTDWINWGRRSGVHPTVLAYIKQNNDALNKLPVAADGESFDDNIQYPSPRSWKAVSDILVNNKMFGDDMSIDELSTLFCMAIGAEMGSAFSAYYQYGETLIDTNDILDGKASTDGSMFEGAGGVERQYIVVQGLISNLRQRFVDCYRGQNMSVDFLTKSGFNDDETSGKKGITMSLEEKMNYVDHMTPLVKDSVLNAMRWFSELNGLTGEHTSFSYEYATEHIKFFDPFVTFVRGCCQAIPGVFMFILMDDNELKDCVPALDAFLEVYGTITDSNY